MSPSTWSPCVRLKSLLLTQRPDRWQTAGQQGGYTALFMSLYPFCLTVTTPSRQFVLFLTYLCRLKMKLTEEQDSEKNLKEGKFPQAKVQSIIMFDLFSNSVQHKIFYFLWFQFGFQWVWLLCLVVALHIAVYNNRHGFRYETNGFWTANMKNEYVFVCNSVILLRETHKSGFFSFLHTICIVVKITYIKIICQQESL